jgi:hypothetical protein
VLTKTSNIKMYMLFYAYSLTMIFVEISDMFTRVCQRPSWSRPSPTPGRGYSRVFIGWIRGTYCQRVGGCCGMYVLYACIVGYLVEDSRTILTVGYSAARNSPRCELLTSSARTDDRASNAKRHRPAVFSYRVRWGHRPSRKTGNVRCVREQGSFSCQPSMHVL